MNAVSIDDKTGRGEAASADVPLRERTASQDVALERCDVVGELVEPLPGLLEGLDVVRAERGLRHGCADVSSRFWVAQSRVVEAVVLMVWEMRVGYHFRALTHCRVEFKVPRQPGLLSGRGPTQAVHYPPTSCFKLTCNYSQQHHLTPPLTHKSCLPSRKTRSAGLVAFAAPSSRGSPLAALGCASGDIKFDVIDVISPGRRSRSQSDR
jgi:hypothetical protein